MDDVSKAELLRSLGYGDPQAAEIVLEAAGLTNPQKKNISSTKTEAVRRVLADHFVRVCRRGDCQTEATRWKGDRTVVPATSPEACDVCCGSVNGRAVNEMADAFRRAARSRLCVVGGSPNARQELNWSTIDRRHGSRNRQRARDLRAGLATQQRLSLFLRRT